MSNRTNHGNAPWGLARLTSDNPPNVQGLSEQQKNRKLFQGGSYIYGKDACGQGVKICVFDEAIRTSHVQFKKSSPPVAYHPDGRVMKEQPPLDPRISDADAPGDDEGWHGTFVAAVAAGNFAGVAKGAEIMQFPGAYLFEDVMTRLLKPAVPATVPTTFLDPPELQEGIHPVVLNLSMAPPPAEDTIKLIRAGVHIVISAGNSNAPASLEDYWDLNGLSDDDVAHLKSAIWVGASTHEDKRWLGTTKADGSAYGPLVDLFAPGAVITSATLKGESDNTLLSSQGTSFAAPHVTGIIACLLSHEIYRDFSPADMKAQILEMALPGAIQDVTIANLRPNFDDMVRFVVAKGFSKKFKSVAGRAIASANNVNWYREPAMVGEVQDKVRTALLDENLDFSITGGRSYGLRVEYIQSLLSSGLLRLLKDDFQDQEYIKRGLASDTKDLLDRIQETPTWDMMKTQTISDELFTTTTLLANCHPDKWLPRA